MNYSKIKTDLIKFQLINLGIIFLAYGFDMERRESLSPVVSNLVIHTLLTSF